MSKKQINVVGAVILKNNKILCAQRSKEGTLPLMWEFPGGKIENGETEEEALIREINEEMDCEISVDEKITTTSYEYSFGIVNLTTFYCTLISGEPKLLEHEKAEWSTAENLHTYDWAPADIPAINLIQERMAK